MDRSLLFRSRMVVFIYDPRLFYRVTKILREKEVEFTVPMNTRYKCRRNEIVLIDGGAAGKVTGECKKVTVDTVRDEDLYHLLVLRLTGKKRYNKLIIGVDPGALHAYVVIGDGELLERGKKSEEALVRRISELSRLPHEDLRVRIGLARGNEETAMRIASLIALKVKCIVELVDEHRTSRSGVLSVDRDRDINAAYRIAFREG